jgi:hypothetical protein
MQLLVARRYLSIWQQLNMPLSLRPCQITGSSPHRIIAVMEKLAGRDRIHLGRPAIALEQSNESFLSVHMGTYSTTTSPCAA